jgi:hypothetical protein
MKKLHLLLALLISFSSLGLQAQQNGSNPAKFRIALNGGYSYRLAKVADNTPADFKQYVKELKSGYNLGLDAHYFFSTWGLGANYSLFKASNTIANVQATDLNGNVKTGSMKDDISIQFVGPSAASRYISSNQKHILITTVAIGYLSYKDELTFAGQSKITGSTLGSSVDLGYDYQLAKKLFIGAKFAFVGGVIKKINYTTAGLTTTKELEKSNYENLGRLDLSAGLRLNL